MNGYLCEWINSPPPIQTCGLVRQIPKVIKCVGEKRGGDKLFPIRAKSKPDLDLDVFRSERLQQQLSWGGGRGQTYSKAGQRLVKIPRRPLLLTDGEGPHKLHQD